MANTVTFDPSSNEAVVETSGGRNLGHVGVYAGSRDTFTGEWREDVDHQQVDEPAEFLPPDHAVNQQLGANPLTDPNSSDESIVAWLKAPGHISQEQMAQIIEGMNQNNMPNHQRDTLVELLCHKEGSLSYEALSEEAREMLGATEFEAGADHDLLDDVITGLPEQAQQQIERMDADSVEDLKVLGDLAMAVEQEPGLADTQLALAEQYAANADYGSAFIAQLSSAFHAGQLTQQQAITMAIEKMGLKDAIDCYSRVSLGYSATGSEITYGRKRS